MIEMFLIALYLFIIGFEIECLGLLTDSDCITTSNKIIMTLFAMTIGVFLFPIALGVKVSKFLDRK